MMPAVHTTNRIPVRIRSPHRDQTHTITGRRSKTELSYTGQLISLGPTSGSRRPVEEQSFFLLVSGFHPIRTTVRESEVGFVASLDLPEISGSGETIAESLSNLSDFISALYPQLDGERNILGPALVAELEFLDTYRNSTEYGN